MKRKPTLLVDAVEDAGGPHWLLRGKEPAKPKPPKKPKTLEQIRAKHRAKHRMKSSPLLRGGSRSQFMEQCIISITDESGGDDEDARQICEQLWEDGEGDAYEEFGYRAGWDESEHPRDDDGKFTDSSGNAASLIPNTFTPHNPPTKHEAELISRGNKITRDLKGQFSYQIVNPSIKTFHNELPLYREHLNNNTVWGFIQTPKGIAAFNMNEVYGTDIPTRELYQLVAQDRGSGGAAMKLITESADRNNVALQLHPVPLSTDGGEGLTMSKAKLENFYASFGFKQKGKRDSAGYILMERKPSVNKKDYDEAKHPRDENGRWTDGTSSAQGIKGLPSDITVKDRLIEQAVERGVWNITAKELPRGEFQSGLTRYELTISAKIPSGIESFRARPEKARVEYYNPKLAELFTENKGEQYIERTYARPLPGFSREIEPLPGSDIIYRGMRAEEYEKFLKTGEVVSTGAYNFPGQEGLTYWATDPATAVSYANGFAPWPHKATFEKPAYVVATRMPKETRHVEGVGENEVGVARAITKDEIVGVWRGDVFWHTPGEQDIQPSSYAEDETVYTTGGGRSASSDLVWQKIDGENSADDIANSRTPASDLLARNNDYSMTLEQIKSQLKPEFKKKEAEALAEMQGKQITSKQFTGADGKYVPERAELHRKIIRELFTPEAIKAATPEPGQKPVLTLSGGRPAAGKTSSLKKELGNKLEKSFYINADEIQEKLPGYKGKLAGLYNGEAQDVALQAEKVARHMGLNILYDATLKSKQPAQERVANYKDAGYDVDGYFVHTTPATSVMRSQARFLGDPDGKGRYLPPEISFNSKTNENTFDSLIPHLRNWALYDNNGTKPVRIAGLAEMKTVLKFTLPTKNGTLTDADFVGDTPPVGASDKKYSDKDTAELMKLADQLKAQQGKKTK